MAQQNPSSTTGKKGGIWFFVAPLLIIGFFIAIGNGRKNSSSKSPIEFQNFEGVRYIDSMGQYIEFISWKGKNKFEVLCHFDGENYPLDATIEGNKCILTDKGLLTFHQEQGRLFFKNEFNRLYGTFKWGNTYKVDVSRAEN